MKRRIFVIVMVAIFVVLFASMAIAGPKGDAGKLWSEEKFEECYEAYSKLLKSYPKEQAQWRYMMGNCKIHLNRVDESFPEYLAALQGPDCENKQKDSVQTNIMSTLGEFAAYEGKPDVILKAIEYYGEPKYSKYQHVYRKWHAGHFCDSTPIGKTKVKTMMTYYLALAYYNAGDKVKAKETLEAGNPDWMIGYISLNKSCPRLEDEVPALLAKCN